MKKRAIRESKYERVARIALRVAEATLPQYSHVKSPHLYTLPQVAACVLLKHYLRLSYRDTVEWLAASDKVCAILGLEAGIPFYSTVQRVAKKLRLADIERMNRWLLEQVGVADEEFVTMDGTGYSASDASWYYLSRSKKVYRHWLKGVYAVGIDSQFILAMRTEWGPSNDVRALDPLRRRAARFARKRHWCVLADSGFDGKSARSGDLIPPVRRHGTITHPDRRARRDLVDAARLDGIYGQRWKSETVNSVIKRRFGSAISARLHSLQWREPHLKALVYNIHL